MATLRFEKPTRLWTNSADYISKSAAAPSISFGAVDPRRVTRADWMNAEHELVWCPAIELRQKDNQFEVLAALPGVDAKDLDVQITPRELLIKADISHRHTAEKGMVHLCEFSRGNVFRQISFPQTVDAGRAKAEFRNGMLRLTAAIAKTAQAREIEVRAA